MKKNSRSNSKYFLKKSSNTLHSSISFLPVLSLPGSPMAISMDCPQIPTVLLTNDDGPCSKEESPFILSFSQLLLDQFLSSRTDKLKVVIPDSQKSWIGKAYIIKDRLSVVHYDPRTGRRATSDPQGEHPWLVVSGTPASCSNLALFNLFPGQIDLVIAGPNFGRNTSSAFSLSSGTVGAAMDAALSNHRAIALSYGIFDRPISDELLHAANQIAVKIIRQLWIAGFEHADDDKPDLYSVNIPLVPAIMQDPQVVWTTESTTRYARLFLPASDPSRPVPTKPAEIDEASTHLDPAAPHEGNLPATSVDSQPDESPVEFVFKPDISALIDPNAPQLVPGSDAWALNKGFCTVTPLHAAFKPAKPPLWNNLKTDSVTGISVWKL